MPFSSLGSQQRIDIILQLKDAAAYIGRMTEAAAATARLSASERTLAARTKEANAQTFIQRQGLYTLRRYAFYATTAFLGLGIVVAGLGLKFYNTMQTGQVAFKGFLGSAKAARAELKAIYATAAETPFTFPALVTATRRLIPFTKNVDLTNKLVLSMANSLSAAGLVTDASLTRQSLQLSHMFAVGRLTGQILYNMGRDSIPMQQALQAAFHASGETIRKDVAGGLISAQVAAKALVQYTTTHKGFAGAAFAQSTRTLQGSFSTLKDLIGMSVGGSEGGLFDSIRKSIRGVDLELIKTAQARKPISLMQLVTAMDRQLSPSTHLIINLFIMFRSALRTVEVEFYLIIKAIQILLTPLNKLGNLFGAHRIAAKLLGIYLGTLVTLWTIGRTRALLFAEAEAIAKLQTINFGKALLILNGEQGILGGIKAWRAWATELTVVSRIPAWKSITGSLETTTDFARKGFIARLSRAIFGIGPAARSAAKGVWAWVEANTALLASIGVYIAIAAILVILYIKWKAFHKAANDLWRDIIYFSPIIAFSLWDAFGPIGVAIEGLILLIRYWKQFKSLVSNNPITRMAGGTGGGGKYTGGGVLGNWLSKEGVPTWLTGAHRIPGAASGGTITSPGSVLVGERGPEILNLPRGATVTPIDTSPLAGTLAVHVYPQHIYMDGKKVGEAVSVAYQDAGARA